MNAFAKTLKRHPFFSRLSLRTLNKLTANAEILELPKGRIIYKGGDIAEGLFLVLSGRCETIISTPEGISQVINIYSPGDTFGERALFAGDFQRSTVRVLTDCVLMKLAASDVQSLLIRSPKLAQILAKRMHDQVISFTNEKEQSQLGRVVSVSSISDHIPTTVVIHNLGLALFAETGFSVLHLHVQQGVGEPTLENWQQLSVKLDEEWSSEELPESIHLDLYIGEDTPKSNLIPPMISALASHFRYVLIEVDRNTSSEYATEFILQADVSYVLLKQNAEDLYHAQLLVRQMQSAQSEEITSILPMVYLEYEERAMPFSKLDDEIGSEVHGIIHGLPPDALEAIDHYKRTSKGRFSSHIRRWAREIGRCRIGLALGSGGAKGLAHIGVIQVLEENNIEVDIIAGTSMGAFVGACWAHGLNGQQMEKMALRLNGKSALWHILDPIIPPRSGLIYGKKIARLLRRAIGDAHYSDMIKDLRTVATNLKTQEQVVSDSGEVVPRVMASMAMPGIILPQVLDGVEYIDGSVSDPVPVDVLVNLGVEKIIAVSTIPTPEEMRESVEAEAGKKKRRSLLAWINKQINWFAEGNIWDIILLSVQGAAVRVALGACKQADVTLRPVACEGKWHNYGQPEKYIRLGRQVAEEQVKELRSLNKRGRKVTKT